MQHTACGEPVWNNENRDRHAEAVAPQKAGMHSARYPPEVQNRSITLQGAKARSRYTDLLKVPDANPCVHDALRMQNLCLEMAKKVAVVRVRLRREISEAVQDADGVLLLEI